MADWRHSVPRAVPGIAGSVILLEAAAGSARLALLTDWLQEAKQTMGDAVWLLECDFDEEGAWAGLQDLLQAIIPELEQQAPELLTRHAYELRLGAPALQERLAVKHPALTDIAQGHERVRNYPLDRAYRSLHGLIDLLDAWYHRCQKHSLVLVCDRYDRASPLVQRFFRELARRRGSQLNLILLLAVDPGQGDRIADQFASEVPLHAVRLVLSGDPPASVVEVASESLVREAQELEQQVTQNLALADSLTPRLISLWQQSGHPEQVLRWKVEAVHRFNQLGLYEAGFRYCEEIDQNLDLLLTAYPKLYPVAIVSLYFCYLSLGYVERAYRLMTEKVLNQAHPQPFLSHCHYLMAMLYARFLPRRELSQAVAQLEQGLALLAEADLTDDVRYFYIVFLKNGLAYVRVQQRQPEEAVALCRGGLELLKKHLASDRHRLHRSVLVYNIAQVYAVTGPFEVALTTFDEVIAMDPYYSEYYNERGSLYFKMGRYQEAERDYLQAIELSPPYAEVWINLGQCYREMERHTDAITTYSRALDLEPNATLPLVGRADMYAELDRPAEAVADYTRALQIDPQQPQVLAARAVTFYSDGQLERALHDLDEAIALAPETPIFYQNRAIALAELQRQNEAAQDLRTYLRLQPDAEDRAEVELQLAQL